MYLRTGHPVSTAEDIILEICPWSLGSCSIFSRLLQRDARHKAFDRYESFDRPREETARRAPCGSPQSNARWRMERCRITRAFLEEDEPFRERAFSQNKKLKADGWMADSASELWKAILRFSPGGRGWCEPHRRLRDMKCYHVNRTVRVEREVLHEWERSDFHRRTSQVSWKCCP
jgi:hypothetical protein